MFLHKSSQSDYEIGIPVAQRAQNQCQTDINHSPFLRASQDLQHETVNENSTPYENDPQRGELFFYGSLLSLCVTVYQRAI